MVDVYDHHFELIADLHYRFHIRDTVIGKFAYVNQTVFTGKNLHECPKRHQAHGLALVSGADFNFPCKQVDLFFRLVGVNLVRRPDNDRTVVRDIDRHAELFDHAANHAAAGADDGADFVRRHLECHHPRRKLAEFVPRLVNDLVQVIEDLQPGRPGLFKSLLHDFEVDALDLDVHLQGRNSLGRASDLEVHVAGVVFGALYVGQDSMIAIFTCDKAHGDSGHRRGNRHAGVHQRERSAAHAGHGCRPIGTDDVGNDPNGVGKFVLRGKYRRERSSGKRAVTDFSPSGKPEPSGLSRREGWEIVMVYEIAFRFGTQRVDALAFTERCEGYGADNLCFAPRKNGGSVHAGEISHL